MNSRLLLLDFLLWSLTLIVCPRTWPFPILLRPSAPKREGCASTHGPGGARSNEGQVLSIHTSRSHWYVAPLENGSLHLAVQTARTTRRARIERKKECELFNYAEMVLLNRPYCKDLRRIHARAYDFDAYFRVVLDDLVLGGVGWRVRRRVKLEIRMEELLRNEAVQRANFCKNTHPGDVVNDSVDDLALEGFEHDSAIARDELGLTVAGEDHALADVRDGDDGDDEAELAGAGALDVGIELGLEVLLHPRPEVGRVEHDRVRELFDEEHR